MDTYIYNYIYIYLALYVLGGPPLEGAGPQTLAVASRPPLLGAGLPPHQTPREGPSTLIPSWS